jgi:hypothetical protein
MPTLGLDLCDAGFIAATAERNAAKPLAVTDARGGADWPGFAYFDGQKFHLGRAAEDQWFVHPRRVVHNYWERLAHEPTTLGPAGKPASFSELSFYFLREYVQRLTAAGPLPGKLMLAVPGAYLKDAATEEEKIGLLLGMAGELKLPLVGIVDKACAALCDPRSAGFNPALPVVVLDLNLGEIELTLFTADQQLQRKDFIHMPQSGLAQLLKQLMATMGNRFLRHTAFDILEDGRIEQTFFRQTKDFLLSGALEHRYQINTATRAYEMVAKREQIAADAASFVHGLVQGLVTFLRNSPHASEPCTVAITSIAATIPGLEQRLRTAGFSRILRLPEGAAACGAACIGDIHIKPPADLSEIQVETGVPLSLARSSHVGEWEARLQKVRLAGPRPTPTHVILDGIGHALGNSSRYTIGTGNGRADLVLPELFSGADDCSIPLLREDGRLWFIDATAARDTDGTSGPATRTAIEAGDRMSIRYGSAAAEILFAHCTLNGSHRD